MKAGRESPVRRGWVMRRFVMMVTALVAPLPWEVRVFVPLAIGFAVSVIAHAVVGMYIFGGAALVLASFVAVDRFDL